MFTSPSTSATLTGRWSTDNTGTDIKLNGNSTGNTSSGFSAWTNFTISGNNFINGTNTLDFLWSNGRPRRSASGDYRHCGYSPGTRIFVYDGLRFNRLGRDSASPPEGRYRCTRPDPPPLSSAFTSSTLERLKSPIWECFRQLAATANSSASCWVGSVSSP